MFVKLVALMYKTLEDFGIFQLRIENGSSFYPPIACRFYGLIIWIDFTIERVWTNLILDTTMQKSLLYCLVYKTER